MRKLWAKRDVDLTSASRWVNIYRKNGKECFLKRGIKGSFVDPKAKKLIAKLHCIRKEQGWVRVYYLTKKDRRRSQACFITKANQMRQMDIRYYRAWKDGLVNVLTIIEILVRVVVGLYRAGHCTSQAVRMILKAAMENKKLRQEELAMRNDRGGGWRFTTKEVMRFLQDTQIIQEFGLPVHPNSLAYMENLHASSAKEFKYWNDFEDLQDFIERVIIKLCGKG